MVDLLCHDKYWRKNIFLQIKLQMFLNFKCLLLVNELYKKEIEE